jgi:hypothetical protein
MKTLNRLAQKLTTPAAALVFAGALFACQGSAAGEAELETAQHPVCSDSQADLARDTENGGNTFEHRDPVMAGEQGTENSAAANGNATDIAAKKADDAKNGGADLVSRLHGCGKVSYRSLGRYLTARGVNIGNTAPAGSAGQLYRDGRTSLGAPSYAGRVREAMFPSTAAHAKLFDILVAASAEVQTNLGAPNGACPGVQVMAAGKMTKDAASCILGMEASDDVVTQANDIIAGNPVQADGVRIAISTLMTSTFTCSMQ